MTTRADVENAAYLSFLEETLTLVEKELTEFYMYIGRGDVESAKRFADKSEAMKAIQQAKDQGGF